VTNEYLAPNYFRRRKKWQKDKRLFYTFSNQILKSKKLLANVKSYGVVKETGIILPFIHALFVKAKSII
jgi:hypothetical protein